jgi:hypothetical protein
MEISLSIYAICYRDDSFVGVIRALDLSIPFTSIEELATWVERHLGDDLPGGPIDVGQVRRQGRRIFARHRREK